ncbi:MAG: hypothetical protein GY906_39945 [bacterium]|nr:hypothetical protein [bacterium]
MQIFVLSMHRSGSSVVTRLLNMMGAYFGPEESSTGASHENPKGFWERRDIRNMNDELLRSAGADWDRLGDLDLGLLPDEARERYSSKARALVGDLDAHRPWVVKEPRLCILFPLWRDLLELPVCVLVHRCPVSVARSLKKRNGFPLPISLALWECYVSEALAASADLPRVLVSYEEIMSDSISTVERLYQQLIDLEVSGLRLPGRREINAFLESKLNHHPREDGRDELLTDPQKELCRILENGSADDLSEVPQVSSQARELLALWHRYQARQTDLVTSQTEFEKLALSLERSDCPDSDLVEVLQNSAQESYDDSTSIENEYLAVQPKIVALGEGYKRQVTELEEARAEKQAVEASEATLQAQYERQKADYSTLRERYEQQQADHSALKERYESQLAELETAQMELRENSAKTTALQDHYERLRAEISALRERYELQFNELETVRTEGRESAARAAALQDHLERQQVELSALRKEHLEQKARLAKTQDAFQRCKKEYKRFVDTVSESEALRKRQEKDTNLIDSVISIVTLRRWRLR